LISIINDADSHAKAVRDPLDRFRSSRDAAHTILTQIREDLLAHKRLREYQADFLLFSIIDKAADELTPIYSAYGHRLRWLQDRLDRGSIRSIKKYVDEVSKVRLELQELRQWIGQMKRIVSHLENDCKDTRGVGGEVPWNFGSDSRGQGKSMLLFLRHTRDYLDQAGERLVVLDDLAVTFAANTERQKSDSMNDALFVLTVATVVMLPAQFFAGVFGMNFKHGMAILEWEHGYMFFWLLSGAFVLALIVLAYIGIRCRRRIRNGYTSLRSQRSVCCCGCFSRRSSRI
jgi:magnesium transporter